MSGTSCWRWFGIPLASPPSSRLLTDTMFSPGAAIPTHGRAIVNFDGWPLGVSEPTDSTYGCHQDGTETEVTPAQLRGSSGRPKSVSGLDSHAAPLAEPAAPLLPAAATITASLSTAAYRMAAPSAPWSTLRSAGRQVTPATVITRAPRSAACTIARPNAVTSTIARAMVGSPPAPRAENFPDVTRNDTNRAPGAMPAKPSLLGWTAIRPATAVPRPSQSARPSVDST